MLRHQTIDYQAERRPHHPGLRAHDFDWDYATWAARSHFVDHWLEASGVASGNRIGVVGLNSAAHFAILFDASRFGAAAVSVNFRLAPAELAFILGDAEIELLFVTDASVANIVSQTLALRDQPTKLTADQGEAWHSLAKLMTTAGEPYTIGDMPDENAPAVQLYTSGTTSKPKGGMLSQHNLLSLT